MNITRSEDVTCQHDIYVNNITSYGRVDHGLWGNEVLLMSWMR
jgi:hypothetical protein